MTLLDRESGAFLGRSGLKWWPEFGEVEVGWVLAPAARGRGLATEAGRASLEWAFRDLDVPYVTAIHRSRQRRTRSPSPGASA